MSTSLPLKGRLPTRIVTAAAALCCAVAAALMAVGFARQSRLLALLSVGVSAGIIVTIIALTRFAVFVLLMLLTRASIDAASLSPTSTTAQLLTPSTIVGVLFIVAAALWLVVAYREQGRLTGSGVRTALVALVCASAVSVPNAIHPMTSLGYVLRLLTIVLMYAVLEQLMFTRRRMIRRVLVAVFCSAIFPILYTAAGFLMGHPRVEVKDGITRILGTFAQSNPFGAYLMLLVIVGVAVLPHVRGRARVGLAALLTACGVCLLLTYALAALLGALAGLVVVGIKQSKRLLLALAAVPALMLTPALSDRLGVITNASTYAGEGAAHGNSLAWRIQYWAQIVHLADRNPATGVGYGMTSYLAQEGKSPHNDYLRAYVETGLVGLAVYLVVIVLLIRLGLQAVRAAPPGTLDRGVAVGYLGCAVALALSSVASNEIISVVQLWYFVAFAAMASAVLRRATSTRPGSTSSVPVRQRAAVM